MCPIHTWRRRLRVTAGGYTPSLPPGSCPGDSAGYSGRDGAAGSGAKLLSSAQSAPKRAQQINVHLDIQAAAHISMCTGSLLMCVTLPEASIGVGRNACALLMVFTVLPSLVNE